MSEPAPVLLFDAHCLLCSRSVQFLLRHEADHVVRFVALTSKEGQGLAEQHGLDASDPQSFLFVEDGKGLQASDAVLALSRHLKWFRHFALLLSVVPKRLRDWAYFKVARNRYQWFGRSDICLMPTPEQRHRFALPS